MENKNNITEAIREIIDTRGISSLEDYAVFCAVLDDIAPLAKVERNIVHRCLDNNTALNLIDIYNSDTDKQTHLFNIINEYLKECLGVSEEWRMTFLSSFASAFTCNYVFSTDKQVETDVKIASSENNNADNRKVLENDIINFERYKPNIIGVGAGHIVGLKNDGTVAAVGDNSFGQCSVSNWKNVVAISARSNQTVALLSDGSVVETGARYSDADVSMVHNWKDMISISCGDNHIIALRKNGKPFGCGANQKGQCDVLPWNNIIDIAAGYYHTLGLRKDGTVVAVGDNKHGECNVSEWTNIKAIAVGPTHSVGVRSDGTVIGTGKNDYGECNVENWSQIIAVKACQRYTMGLRSDGTVILTGENTADQYDVSGWTDIVSIGIYFKPAGLGDIKVTLVGVQSNGNVKVAGDTDFGQDKAENWNLFSNSSPVAVGQTSSSEYEEDSYGFVPKFDPKAEEIRKEINELNEKLSTLKGPLSALRKKAIEEKIKELNKQFFWMK
ncbi:RCC1 domain-containing protein [Claveliimonas bilis]|uniref:RCC1 domain-containing protein n=1 Tax=Claveliimonas bilis TaxID=3028070 RepID=UPI00292E5ABA|nr:hypothetical protein [Claveliimonas bilis]BDZ79873.1 hypothetical protein Lac3_10820 [Claveliimonas bilis]